MKYHENTKFEEKKKGQKAEKEKGKIIRKRGMKRRITRKRPKRKS